MRDGVGAGDLGRRHGRRACWQTGDNVRELQNRRVEIVISGTREQTKKAASAAFYQSADFPERGLFLGKPYKPTELIRQYKSPV